MTLYDRLQVHLKSKMKAMMDNPAKMVKDDIATEIARCYGFKQIEDWRWIGSIGKLQADGKNFVVRLYTNVDLVIYQTELICWLKSAGVNAEEIIHTTSGNTYTLLSTGKAVALFIHYSDPKFPFPLEQTQDDTRAWGRFVARMHAACELWPSNLLKGSTGLVAIDFGESGDGPRAIDLATAFRWMPWDKDPNAANLLWQRWLSGYLEILELSELELSSVRYLACLQRLRWLVIEATDALEGVPGAGEVSWYVEDHCRKIQILLSKR